MNLKNYSIIFATALLSIILTTCTVSASLGQSAGALDFGDIPRGGKETLSYGVKVTGKYSMTVTIQLSGEIEKYATVEPKVATIPANSYIPVYVTVKIPRNATPGTMYEGHVLVKQAKNSPAVEGGLTFDLGLFKYVKAVAGEEIAPVQKEEPPAASKQKELPYLEIFILGAVVFIFLLIDPFGWRRTRSAEK